MSGKVGRVAGVLCCLCSEDKIIGRCVVKALVVGFLIFTLFKVLSWVFFILCSNVMNSYQKIFGANLRSHDPPPKRGHFIGFYSHYESFMPTSYKAGLTYPLLHSAFTLCSTWERFLERDFP